jgi:hypothetical protein
MRSASSNLLRKRKNLPLHVSEAGRIGGLGWRPGQGDGAFPGGAQGDRKEGESGVLEQAGYVVERRIKWRQSHITQEATK